MADAVLRIESLTKNFGGLRVTDDVTLDVMPGELHAVIGPNGAGKTTLINQISGLLAPDAGAHRVRRRGCDAPAGARARGTRACALVPDHLDPAALLGAGERRARRAGASRHELPLFRHRSRRGGAERAGAARRSRRSALRNARTRRPANSRMARSARWSWRSRSRWSRSCCCSTSRWPAPGTTRPSGWSRCCARLKGRFPMVLVEHDMTAVFALADRISVLIYGRILASGTPDDRCRADPAGRHRLSRRRRWEVMLACVDETAGRLRPRAGAVRRELFGRRGRGRDAARPQRHGQDHDHPHADGAVAGARRQRAVRRRSLARPPALSDRAARARPRAGRPPDVSDAVGRGKSGRDGGSAPRRGAMDACRASTSSSRALPSGAPTWAISSPAASSRCWRSAAR